MFKIIGGDGRQYGPIPTDQVRQWILEGRANAQTLAQPAGATDWRPLGSFGEFATPLSTSAAPPVITQQDTRKSKLVAGLFGVLLGAFGIHRFYLGYVGIGIAQIIVTICTLGIGGVWGFIEGILILCGNTITTDADGQTLKEQ